MTSQEPTPQTRRTCGAKTRAGGTCQVSRQLYPNGRCHKHGGPSRGPRTWKAGGAHSKVLAAFLRDVGQRAEDPAIFDVRPKIALMDEAEGRLLDRALNDRDTPRFRESAHALAVEVQQLLAIGDQGVVGRMADLVGMLKRGVAHDRALKDATDLAERRIEKTCDVRHVMVKEAQSVTSQQFADFVRLTLVQIMRAAGPTLGPSILHAVQDAWHGRDTRPELRKQLAEVVERHPQAPGTNGAARPA